MATGRITFTSLDDTYGLNSPSTGFFSGSARSWDGDIVPEGEYWAEESKKSANAAAASAEAAAAIASAIQEKYFGPYPAPGPTYNPITGGSLEDGDIFYNTTDDEMMVYNGTAWVFLGDTTGINELLGGTNINVSPDPGIGDVTVNLDTDITVGTINSGSIDSSGSGTFATGLTATNGSITAESGNLYSSVSNTGAALYCKQNLDSTGRIANFYGPTSPSTPVVKIENNGSISSSGSATFDGTVSSAGSTALTEVTGVKINAVSTGVINVRAPSGASVFQTQSTSDDIIVFSSGGGGGAARCTIENDGSIDSKGSGTFSGKITSTNQIQASLGFTSINGAGVLNLSDPTVGPISANQAGGGWIADFQNDGIKVCRILNDGSIDSSGSGTFATGLTTSGGNLTTNNGNISANINDAGQAALYAVQSGSGGVIARFRQKPSGVVDDVCTILWDGSIDSKGTGTFAGGVSSTVGFDVAGSPVFMESQHDTFKSELHTAVNAATDYQSLKDAILTALA